MEAGDFLCLMGSAVEMSAGHTLVFSACQAQTLVILSLNSAGHKELLLFIFLVLVSPQQFAVDTGSNVRWALSFSELHNQLNDDFDPVLF